MLRHPLLAALASLVVAGCGSEPASTPSPTSGAPSPTPTLATTPTPMPTPPPVPETETIQVVKVGVGAYMLEAMPVAVLHNLATGHTANAVVVRFSVHAGNGSIFALNAPPVSLGPTETLAVAAQCTDTCNHATRTDVSITVGGWIAGGRAVITTAGVKYACGSCGRGSGYGTVTGAMSGMVSPGQSIYAVASCMNSSGSIVGGGSTQTVWPPGSSFGVSVLVSVPPAGCQLFATVS